MWEQKSTQPKECLPTDNHAAFLPEHIIEYLVHEYLLILNTGGGTFMLGATHPPDPY